MRGAEAQALIEAVGVGALLVGLDLGLGGWAALTALSVTPLAAEELELEDELEGAAASDEEPPEPFPPPERESVR